MSQDYNNPPEGLKELTLEEWTRYFFHYQLNKDESRQVRIPDKHTYYDLRMFDIPNFEIKKLGVAVMRDWFDSEKRKNRPENIIRFCRYGLDEDWIKFENRFAAQFAGDNS